MTDYHECIKLIEDHVKQFSAAELKEMNAQKRQAGVRCLKFEDFKKTEYVGSFQFEWAEHLLTLTLGSRCTRPATVDH